MPVALHRWQQSRDHRLQPLAADPVGRLPEHDQRLAHRCVVDPPFQSRGWGLSRWTDPKQAQCVLAVMARHGRELVQDTGLLPPLATSVSSRQGHKQFIARRHAHPPHRHPRRRTRVGSKSDEATTQQLGAFQVRQCDQSSRLSRYVAEPINGLFKAEVIHRRGPWRLIEPVEFAPLEWVDCFNTRRLLEPIGNIPPAEAKARYCAQAEIRTLAA